MDYRKVIKQEPCSIIHNCGEIQKYLGTIEEEYIIEENPNRSEFEDIYVA